MPRIAQVESTTTPTAEDGRTHPTAALITETTTQAQRPIAAPRSLTIAEVVPGLFNGTMCGDIKADTEYSGQVCVQPGGHDGNHRSGNDYWPQNRPLAPFTLTTPPPRRTEHAEICERDPGHYGECASRTLNLNLTNHRDDGLGILQAEIAVDDETDDLVLRSDFGDDDWEITSSAQFRRLTAAARVHLDELDKLADRYDAITGASA